jgi:RNA polymerase sigma-70 factor (ECF subfamily)
MGLEQLTELVDRHAAALVLYARQWCAAPEDVVQEAFVKLASQRRWPEQTLAWLYRVVRNGAISAARAAQRRHRHEQSAARPDVCWFQPAAASPLEEEEVTQALKTLPLEQREIIVAHLWGGLTFEQIAAVTGCAASTAHRRYQTGLQTLRERLQIPCPADHKTT